MGVGIGSGRFLGEMQQGCIRTGALKLPAALCVAAMALAATSSLWVPPVAGAFVNDAETIANALTYVHIMLVANSFLIVTYTLNGVFEGAGITWPILLGGLASYGVVEFPLLFIVYIWFPGQPDLLWLVVALAAAVGMLITLALFRLGAWSTAQKDDALHYTL